MVMDKYSLLEMMHTVVEKVERQTAACAELSAGLAAVHSDIAGIRAGQAEVLSVVLEVKQFLEDGEQDNSDVEMVE